MNDRIFYPIFTESGFSLSTLLGRPRSMATTSEMSGENVAQKPNPGKTVDVPVFKFGDMLHLVCYFIEAGMLLIEVVTLIYIGRNVSFGDMLYSIKGLALMAWVGG